MKRIPANLLGAYVYGAIMGLGVFAAAQTQGPSDRKPLLQNPTWDGSMLLLAALLLAGIGLVAALGPRAPLRVHKAVSRLLIAGGCFLLGWTINPARSGATLTSLVDLGLDLYIFVGAVLAGHWLHDLLTAKPEP